MDYQDVLNAAKNLSETERGKLVRAIWPSFNKDFDLKSAIVVSFRKRERSTVRDHELIWIDLKNVSDLAIQLNSITVDTGDEFTTRFIPANDLLPPGTGCGHALRMPFGHNDVLRIMVYGHTMIAGGIASDAIVGYEPSLF